MKQFKESMDKLEEEITSLGEMSSHALRKNAKTIACIGLDHFKDELLDRCLSISATIVAFVEELEEPSPDVPSCPHCEGVCRLDK